MRLIECPRDAMQGIKTKIPTNLKIKYINTLLRVGFNIIDFGSFVSKLAIPQMSDTQEIIDNLYLSDTNTQLLSIVGNLKGAQNLIKNKDIKYIGFPFSISNTFLKLNINSTIEKSLNRLNDIIDISIPYDKNIIVYISMSFGNPYEDMWNVDLLLDYIDRLSDMGINDINISDTMGFSTPESIELVFNSVINEYPDIHFGFHLHTNNNWYNKIRSAYISGVRSFDSVIGGVGGCPMTGYELVKNLNTIDLIDFCFDNDIELKLDEKWLKKSIDLSNFIYDKYK